MSEKTTRMGRVRRVSRWLHRDLSYLFAGALLVYAISGICLISQHHLIHGIGRCCRILQIIAGIMPTSSDVNMLSAFSRMVFYVTVMLMTGIFQKWIISAATITILK